MNRGFFSVFVATFAIVFLIGLTYTQSSRFPTESTEERILVLQQQLSKEWFMARNAYVNFSSDAIFEQVASNNPNSSGVAGCNPAWVDPAVDFGPSVQSYWDSVYGYLRTNYGVDCRAVLDVDVHNKLESTNLSGPETVTNGSRAYARLTCLKNGGGIDLNLTHPFVIKKKMEISLNTGVQCDVNVFDIMGDIPQLGVFPPVPYKELDVNQAFP